MQSFSPTSLKGHFGFSALKSTASAYPFWRFSCSCCLNVFICFSPSKVSPTSLTASCCRGSSLLPPSHSDGDVLLVPLPGCLAVNRHGPILLSGLGCHRLPPRRGCRFPRTPS